MDGGGWDVGHGTWDVGRGTWLLEGDRRFRRLRISIEKVRERERELGFRRVDKNTAECFQRNLSLGLRSDRPGHDRLQTFTRTFECVQLSTEPDRRGVFPLCYLREHALTSLRSKLTH
jgi:hypothetical protein